MRINSNGEEKTTGFESLLEKGFMKISCSNVESLIELRTQISSICENVFKKKWEIPDSFSYFHRGIDENFNLNEKRVSLISKCTELVPFQNQIYKAFDRYIDSLIGTDVLVQKKMNLVIDLPHSEANAEFHRDAPLNSFYELVFWIPLTSSKNSKNFYILDKLQSKKVLTESRNRENWADLVGKYESIGNRLEVNFGEALVFNAGLFHGSIKNLTDETRWTINVRFKHVFSPSGKKDPFQFFSILHLSNLTKLGVELERFECEN